MKKKQPKQPKAKALPKKPKASASLESWKNWKSKCESVTRENASKLAAWKKACAKIVSDEKQRQAIINASKRY